MKKVMLKCSLSKDNAKSKAEEISKLISAEKSYLCTKNQIYNQTEKMTDGIKTLHYSDLFLAMYFEGGRSCTHRNHSHVLVYMYSGEMVIDERGKITRLHKGDCAFIRKDFSVQMTKQAWNGEQFKAIFLMFTPKFLRDFYSRLNRDILPKDAKRDKISLYKLPSNRPDIVSLFESMTPYFDSSIHPTEELLQLKRMEGIYVLLNTSKNLYASVFDFADPWKIDILDFLEHNYMNTIQMKDIAEEIHLCESECSRLFKRYMNVSLFTFLQEYRVERSLEFLLSSDDSIMEVAQKSGFTDSNYYAKVFSRVKGCSPQKYRKHSTEKL